MGELKIGTATSEPAAGTLKVGSNDVQEIYVGANKIWPSAPLCPGAEEVQIGNLIWKTANTDSLEGSSGNIIYYAQISSITARDSYTNEIPIATLYLGTSTNQQYGRYYNKYAARNIIPPTGFRLPTDADFENLNSELQQLFNEQSNGVTSIGGGDINYWAELAQQNYYFGRSCFNSRGVGSWRPNPTGNNKSGQDGEGRYWTQEQADLSGITNNLVKFSVSANNRILKTDGFDRDYIFAPIRFCKDAPLPPPEEVQIGNLIWTTANSVTTASSEGTIPIAANPSEMTNAYNNQLPMATYWFNDSSYSYLGLYYNPQAATIVTPPSGFRMPTDADWNNLVNELGNIAGITNNVTAGGGVCEECGDLVGNWDQDVYSNPVFGQSGFNAIEAGWVRRPNAIGNPFWASDQANWWSAESISGLTGSPSFFEVGAPGDDYIEYQTRASSDIYYYTIRFCKDA